MKPLLANPNEGSCKKMGKEESMSSTGGDNNKIESTSLIVQDMRLASINTLLKTARDVFADKVAQSNELDLSAEERVPKFEAKDLMIGRVVGRGGFCVVQDVKGLGTNGIAWGDDSSVGGFIRRIRGKRPEEEFPSRQQRLHPTNDGREVNQAGVASTMDEWTSASELSDQVDEKKKRPLNLMKRKEKRKYVLKRMGVDLEKITFLKGVVDLAMETRFLASLDHINIIGLYGVSGDGPFVQGYFLILEKMKEILPKRIKRWMDIDRQCKGITGVFTGSKKKVRTLESDRIATAVDIARGAHYLHERNIVFRDLVSER